MGHKTLTQSINQAAKVLFTILAHNHHLLCNQHQLLFACMLMRCLPSLVEVGGWKVLHGPHSAFVKVFQDVVVVHSDVLPPPSLATLPVFLHNRHTLKSTVIDLMQWVIAVFRAENSTIFWWGHWRKYCSDFSKTSHFKWKISLFSTPWPLPMLSLWGVGLLPLLSTPCPGPSYNRASWIRPCIHKIPARSMSLE